MTDRITEAVAEVRGELEHWDSAGFNNAETRVKVGTLRAILAHLDVLTAQREAIRERLARAEADTARLDWLEQASANNEDAWADIWYSSLRLRPYVDRALDAARRALEDTP